MTAKNSEIIREQAAKIVASGVLGRSRTYPKLFDYLVENTLIGRAPKEVEIAADVFARDKSFDPTQDSMVRVYAHNLRQKIRHYYEQEGSGEQNRLYIPRGEYRLAVAAAEIAVSGETATAALHEQRKWLHLQQVAIGIGILIFGIALGFILDRDEPGLDRSVADSALWAALTDDEIAVQVVVGNYYIFGELDGNGDVARIVREFDINSRADLDQFIRSNPQYRSRYQDLSLTYLAESTAAAVADVLGVLNIAGKEINVVAMSEFDPADVRTQHIVYVGYFSALDKLFDFALAASQIAIGETFDELWNLQTGEVYASEAGLPTDYRNYKDYGYFSTFPGPGGNQFVIIAGTRDEGLLHTAQAVADSQYMSSTVMGVPNQIGGTSPAFELLYEVTGFDRTHIDAMLVHSAVLDPSKIWLGTSIQTSEFAPE